MERAFMKAGYKTFHHLPGKEFERSELLQLMLVDGKRHNCKNKSSLE
jgi:hypothetical protein